MTKYALILVLAFLSAGSLRAQDVEKTESMLSPFELEESTAPLREWPTPFAKELAERLKWPLEKLEKLEKRGFGRTEMISFVAIARRSSKSWDELIKQREKGSKMRAMAEEAGLVYNDLFRESQKIKAEVDAKVVPLETSRRGRAKSAEKKETP